MRTHYLILLFSAILCVVDEMNKDNVEKPGLLKDIAFLIVLILMYLGIFLLPWPKGEENWGVLFLVIPIFIAIIYRIGLIIKKTIHYLVFWRTKKKRSLRPEDKDIANSIVSKVFIAIAIGFFIFCLTRIFNSVR